MSIELTVFYDHACPFCRTEMMRLKAWDKGHRLGLIDMSAPGFDAATHGFTREELDRELCGITAEGNTLRGLACVRRVYEFTWMGPLWRITDLPGLRPVFDRFYLWFARNRLAMSAWLGYTRACRIEDGVCQEK
jgi:predicted DCC family thiol-disulfide oxidoreductase YuxK